MDECRHIMCMYVRIYLCISFMREYNLIFHTKNHLNNFGINMRNLTPNILRSDT